jgi:hypothetical protein
MRTTLFLAALSVAGCSWTEFDDIADSTWVRSDSPNVGSRDYGRAIVGVTTSTSGGLLGVISDDSPDFSTLVFDADGNASVGPNTIKLGQHRIATLSDPPLFITDGNGKIALVERSTSGGVISVVSGSVTAPTGLEFSSTASPESLTFAGSDLIVTTGNLIYRVTPMGQPMCNINDSSFTGYSAIASDGTNLWFWSKTGVFFSYPIATVAACPAGGMLAPPTVTLATNFMPNAGSRIHLAGNVAVLAGHPPNSRMGQIFVVNIATPTTSLSKTDEHPIEGLQSSTLATFGATTYVVAGVPDRAVDGVVAGQVELLALDTTAGTLTKTPALVLNDAQPNSGQAFGRSVTTMKFNDKQILVIAALSEVFAYYKTALYDALP